MRRLRYGCVVMVWLGLMLAGCSDDHGGTPVTDYEAIGPFSDGLAMVKLGGKWGFIAANGEVAITPRYDAVTGFSEGLAGFEVQGRWGFMDKKGEAVIQPSFAGVRSFSEGVAAAQKNSRSTWGYVNAKGQMVVPPQFDRALSFSDGLAPVYKDGKWRCISANGNETFETDFYRIYPFAGGLALIREKQNGKYGYIGKDGTVMISPIFSEARGFAQGLAAVRDGEKWGYIDPSGKYVIQPTYDYASSFSGGLAAVQSAGESFYIGQNGKRAIQASFESATPFSDGRAIVLSNGLFSYIDQFGSDLRIAQAPPPRNENPLDQCGDEGFPKGVVNSFQGGFTRFNIVNVGTPPWDITVSEMSDQVNILPGIPSTLERSGDPQGRDHLNFMAHYDSAEWASGNFQIELSNQATGAHLTLDNSTYYKAPPKPAGSPFFDFLKASIHITLGLIKGVTGHPVKATADFLRAAHDIASGVADGKSTNNALPSDSGTFMQSQLTGSPSQGNEGAEFYPVSGSFCGGDEYAITDGSSLVADMTATRSGRIPGEVNLTIYSEDMFYAFQAASALDSFRRSMETYRQPPYDQIQRCVFQNYTDAEEADPTELCQNADGSEGYLAALSTFSHDDLVLFLDFANGFSIQCSQEKEKGLTKCQYWAARLAYDCGCGK